MSTTPESKVLNPVEGIKQEVEKAKRAPKKRGIFSVKKANDWIKDSRERPDPRSFFHGLIVEYECTVIFASSGVGKSIFVTQIAEEIAWKEPLLFIDLELADKQFQMRYTDPVTNQVHMFPDNFERAEIDPELIVGEDLEEAILDSIEDSAKRGTRFFVLDNITFACNDSEKGATAGQFMMKMIRLKKKYHLTIIVIAHTPKRRGYEPITQNDLAGSAKLINFFDAGIAIVRSARDPNLRYVKQVKVRTGEFLHDADNVIIYDVNKVDGFLKFEFREFGKEGDHLKVPTKDYETDENQDILKLQHQGKSLREIAKDLDMSLGMVQRRLKKAAALNIKYVPEEGEESADVSDVSPASDAIQPIQDDTAVQQRLPYKEEEA
ncbi:MAG: AAA family ATPase [Bacteroidales bacterium]|nr:AAA family ATPase [Bacteroidales bacterium]